MTRPWKFLLSASAKFILTGPLQKPEWTLQEYRSQLANAGLRKVEDVPNDVHLACSWFWTPHQEHTRHPSIFGDQVEHRLHEGRGVINASGNRRWMRDKKRDEKRDEKREMNEIEKENRVKNTLFWVRVPVLSEAMISTDPRVSTVGRLFTRAYRRKGVGDQ